MEVSQHSSQGIWPINEMKADKLNYVLLGAGGE